MQQPMMIYLLTTRRKRAIYRQHCSIQYMADICSILDK